MKKILALLLALSMLFALTACGGDDENIPTCESTEETTESTENDNTTSTESKTDSTDTAHSHEYIDKTIAATCIEDGYTAHICACGNSYRDNKIVAIGHNFGEWQTTKEPTATATGSAERKCSKCDKKETKVIGKLIENHQHSYTPKITTPSTCAAVGTKTFSCLCGETYTETISKTPHKYSDNITNPTCTNGGYTTHSCSVCGDYFSDSNTNPTGHNWKVATCTAPKTCLSCNATEGKAAGHSWNTASCTNPKTCSKCYITEGSPIPHSWRKATCTVPQKCSQCGKTEGSAIGHDWVDATCTTPKTCSKCAATDGKAFGHNYSGGKCTTCDKIQPYYRTKKLLDEYMGVKFYYTGIDQYSNLFYINLRIENTTDEFVTVQIRDELVNGHSNKTACSEDIAPNQTKSTSILVVAFSGSPSLRDYGEDIVEYIEFNFYLYFFERTEDKFYTSPKRIVLYPYE